MLTGKGRIFITGDFNSRTSKELDFILDDEVAENMSHILPDNYISDYYLPRKSLDKVLNSQGKELLNLCASAQLRLLNGRYIGDVLGNITCYNAKGCSIVDYAAASVSLLSSVKYFIVKNPTCYSDHCQLVTYLDCHVKKNNVQSDYLKQEFSFKWTKLSKNLLEKELSQKYVYDNIANFELFNFENSTDGVNTANEMLTDIYTNLSEKCMRKHYYKKKKRKFKSPWSDSEFLALRNNVNSLGKNMKLFPFDQNIRLKFLHFSKLLKRATKFKRKEYKKNMLNKLYNLSPNESKEFWKILRSIDNKEGKSEDSQITDLNLLASHFKKQGQPEKIDPNFEKFLSAELSDREQLLSDQYTDDPITITEIKSIIKKLKNGKSSGPDLICYEVIKHSSHAMLTSLAKFFNLILKTSVYPEKWNKSFIIPVFKGGDQLDPMNYRGISLMNCLSKLFNSLINNRLLEIFENKINPSQFGFRKNSRTSDSLFIVKSVISKYVNTDNKKLFGCFIDLKKAFDSVWRLGLLYKIIKNDNIGLKLYNIIKDMYKQTEASVKVGENLSNYVSIDRGVKQGDSLSPNLFNIYINDLPDIFDKSCQPVTIDKLTISCLMFADDILLLSESAEGLQNALNKVAEYCRKWQLSVNTKKTKIIVFQKKNIPYTKSDFFLNGCKLEKVLKYKYLGNLIEASGKFHSTHVELSKKGSKVLFSMFKSLNPSDNIPLNIHKKLFDSLVKPILMYNSEIWYMDFYEKIIKKQLRANKSNTNFDILALLDSSFVEKVNLKFCKFVLGISKKSVNIAARAEISQYPVDVYIKLQVLKYLARISNNNNNPLLVDAYHLSKCLHSKGSYSWYSFAENICSYNKIDMKDIENIDYKKEKCSFSKTIKNQLQENYE